MHQQTLFGFLIVALLLFGSSLCSRVGKKRKQKTSNSAICNCELHMASGWANGLMLKIFNRPVAAWGAGKSTCSRVREGCRILCSFMGKRYLEGVDIDAVSQGTRLGQRLCEIHSYRNGYRPINPPGKIVSVNYMLEDKCWKQSLGYAVAFRVHGNLCCKPVSPFKAYPFVRLYVWNKDCVDNKTHN